MNAMTIIARQAYMSRRHPEFTAEMREDWTYADVALQALIAAAVNAAAELAQASRPKAAVELLSAVNHFKHEDVCTDGVLRGNADLVPAEHKTMGVAA